VIIALELVIPIGFYVMPNPDAPKMITFESAKELRKWLQANHASENELLIKMFKKNSGISSVS